MILKRVETAGVYPLVRPRGVSALPAEVQRKTLRPSGANTLTQFVCPGQPVLKKSAARQGRTRLRQFAHPAGSVQKRSRPDRANTLTQFAYPGQPVLKKLPPRSGEPPARFVCPA